jgi:hypothetical protein
MSNGRSMPFSNGTEYEVFLYNFCERCRNNKLREDGFPEFPEKGGCPIRDAMENARFDIGQFPVEWVRELRDATDNHVIAWHYCIRFSNPDWDVMESYFTMMKNALIKREAKDAQTEV